VHDLECGLRRHRRGRHPRGWSSGWPLIGNQ